MASGKGNLIIVVSKFSLLEDCRRVGKTLYLIQNKPAGYPKQDLWSSNSTLDQFLASPAFENLEVERKNNVLRGVNANFLIETVEQTRVERDESADELGQDYQPTQQLFVNMERPTLPASTGSMDDLIASLKHKSEMEGVSRNTSNASPAKSQNMSTMSNNRLSRLPPGSRPELIRHSIQPSATSSGNAQSGKITSRPPSQAVATPSRLQNSSSNGRSTPRIQLSSTPRSSSFGSLSQRPKSPAKLSVVIGGARSVTTPRPQQKFSALRIEVPSNTPEKLLSKQLPLDSFMNSQGQVKKRGRPFQSKEAEEKARLKAVIRQQKTDGTYVHDFKKRIGRPARIPPKHTIVTVPEFEFAVFRCKFAGCPAQLSNTETLKKHVYIVHGKRGRRKNEGPKKYVCTWEGCCELAGGRSDDDLAMERVSTSNLKFKWKTEFDRLDQWKEHVDNEHIDYVRWTQGDGPLPQDLQPFKKPRSLYEREPWLFDEHGQRLIPEIDLSRVYHESPKEHYTRLFKRTRDEDGDWIYSLKENLETMPPCKKSRQFKDDNEQSDYTTPQEWEQVPEDIGERSSGEERETGKRFMGMQICQ